jgi:hypothetical protein
MTTHGGKRTGAGRKPGAVSKVKRALSEMAREYGDEALQTLVSLMKGGESDQVRLSAANAILDRGYGKPPASLEVTGADGGPIQTQEVSPRERIARRLAGLSAAVEAEQDTGRLN